MIGLPVSTRSMRPSAWPTAGMPSARATIATWLVLPPSSRIDAAQLGAVIVEEFGRPHVARDDDGILRQVAARRGGDLAGQDAQQPVGQIVEIMHALAQIGIGRAHHAGAVVVLHALDRGFGGQAGLDRLAQPVHPAAVMREHAEGFEHLGIFACPRRVGAVDQLVDMGAQLLRPPLRAAAFPSECFRR